MPIAKVISSAVEKAALSKAMRDAERIIARETAKAAEGVEVEFDKKHVDKMLRNLGQVSDRTEKRGASAAVRAGGTSMIKAIRNRAPVRTGTLKKNITQKVKTYRSGNKVSIIGAKSVKVPIKVVDGLDGEIKSKYANPANYFHLVEYGTKPHRMTRKLGKGKATFRHPGAKANPFARSAWSSNTSMAKRAVVSKLSAFMEKEAKKVRA